MGDKSKNIKEKFSDMMELPKELLLDIPRLTMLGNEDILIENYKGIVEYEENVIRLSNKINIFGERLNVEEITDTEIMITGKINNVEFEN
ncbi:MAG: sporulation protein YqfC [Clostridia bacterium]|nr:sporulation protein YqfC [Clostridia bacterium]